ncbi:MAG: 6,7-dimethyl-8-ribityllumazine synthase [Gammaproteobacteria bacterium]
MKQIIAQDIKSQFNIAIVISRFNEEITQQLYEGAIERLRELNFSEDQITVIWVPGAVEIPVVTQRIAQQDAFEAIICLGAVIRGETDHYDYVCRMVSDGCQRVALENDVPVIFGVLTTENEEQAQDRVGGAHGNKGRYCVDAAFEMVSVLRQVAKL